MAKETKTEASIIKIIQDMVKEGESDESIVASLKELGVEADKAKRLLLLGQADTFALLQNEIAKIAREDVQKEVPELKKMIIDETRKNTREIKEQIIAEVVKEYDATLKQYQKQLKEQQDSFKQEKERFHRELQAVQADFRKRSELLEATMDKLISQYQEKINNTQENFEKLLREFETSQQQKMSHYQSILNKNEKKVDSAIEQLDREIEEKKKRFDEIRIMSQEEAQKKADSFENDLQARVEKATRKFKQFEQAIHAAEANLSSKLKSQVETSIDLSERVRDKLNELGEQVYQAQADLQEIKAQGIGSRNKVVSIALLLLGLVFCSAALYLFFVIFEANATVDAIIMTVALALVGTTMLFVSTVI